MRVRWAVFFLFLFLIVLAPNKVLATCNGNGVCDVGESSATCYDCGTFCSNTVCDPGLNENCGNCPSNCPCGSGYTCSSGTCVASCTNTCTTENAYSCSSNNLYKCVRGTNGCLSNVLQQSCGSLTCDAVNHQCVSSCSDDCVSSTKTCSGSSVMTCGECDSDSCEDWCYTSTCPTGTTCTGTGNCVENCVTSAHSSYFCGSCTALCTYQGLFCTAGTGNCYSCVANAHQSGSTCVCNSGYTGCPASNPTGCYLVSSDSAHCGASCTVCAEGQSCVAGVCKTPYTSPCKNWCPSLAGECQWQKT